MKLKNEVEYVFRILLYMSSVKEDRVIPSTEISEMENIPHLFSLSILKKMEKAGIVEIIKGARGGYKLLKKAEEITLRDAVSCIDNDFLVRNEEQKINSDSSFSIIYNKIKEVEKQFINNLEKENFKDLSDNWLSNR